MSNSFIIPFSKLSLRDLAEVGGKNASLGEMFNQLTPLGIRVPDGFAVTSTAYRHFLDSNQLNKKLTGLLSQLDKDQLSNLPEIGKACRELVGKAKMPEDLILAIVVAYEDFAKQQDESFSVAVRSSATAEDLPTASFAGQHESFLNIKGKEELVKSCQACYISLFNDRAIKYRIDNGFEPMDVELSIGIQKMVRSDLASAGVAFTIDPESGFKNVTYLTGAWGLGENIVQGAIDPDEYLVFKPTLKKDLYAILKKKAGLKEKTMVYAQKGSKGPKTLNEDTSLDKRKQLVLTNKEIHQLANWCQLIEDHYNGPMDIEWAKDGIDDLIYIVQARPETVQSQTSGKLAKTFTLKTKSKEICSGKSVGHSIVSGRACVINSLADAGKLQQGDIIIADITNPDWNALLKKAVSIVTNKGGRTSHASIVARELGIPAVVGTNKATDLIEDGQMITVRCADSEIGRVFEGALKWEEKSFRLDNLPETHTDPMLILANPDRAFELSFYPNKGVGLLRMEFIINNTIAAHPMALAYFETLPDGPDTSIIEGKTYGFPDKKQYFIEKLSEGVGQVAAAFFPKDVIVRMSDFKTNEYASLLGGKFFEPEEENPMIGFRGASRYYHAKYKEGFKLECEAMKFVRDKMGLTNVKLMIPFCRTVEVGKKVLEIMENYGLTRGENGLEIYMMIEIPSNVILAEEFAKIFDGFSIGSNDLTQLTLGIDRDSSIISDIFDERNAAPMWMIKTAIQKAKKTGTKIGLCGQAPSDYPEFAHFLVEEGIDSISFNPDSLIRGIENIAKAEESILIHH